MSSSTADIILYSELKELIVLLKKLLCCYLYELYAKKWNLDIPKIGAIVGDWQIQLLTIMCDRGICL